VNITEAEKVKITKWLQERTLPPRYIDDLLEALEKEEEPLVANQITFPVLGWEPLPDDDLLQDLKFVWVRLVRQGDSWYLNCEKPG